VHGVLLDMEVTGAHGGQQAARRVAVLAGMYRIMQRLSPCNRRMVYTSLQGVDTSRRRVSTEAQDVACQREKNMSY
jgi:hypothetical protein